MTVTCPDCQSVFRVDPAKVPASGVRARCAVCGGVIAIAGGTLPVAVAVEGGTTVPPAPALAIPPMAPAPMAGSMRPGPTGGGTAGLGVAAPAAGEGAPPPVVPRRPTPAYTDIPVSFPALGRTGATPAVGVAPVGALPPAEPSFASPAEAASPFWGGMDAAPEAVSPSQPSAATAEAAASAPLPPTEAPPAVPRAGGGARPSINPFLRADPATRARLLARALVSDLAAYHPQKREEGLRDGTLRQLFREDIRKSYEEYVEQVGREFAERSRDFQDALNDILAGGRSLF